MASNSSGGGIGFVGLLTVVFITLKLTNTISWSWWWVLSPIWIVATIIITMAGMFLIWQAQKGGK